MAAVASVAVVVGAYLVGTFPSAVLVARSRGVDIRTTGSGNPGASNVSRSLGWRSGVLVFVLDALKGAIPALVGILAIDRPIGYAAGAAAVLGHMFPATRPAESRWRGGKGVATVGGVMAVLQPLPFLVMLALWFAVSRLPRTASLASLAIVVGMPITMALFGEPGWEIAAVVAIGVLVLVRHRTNIVRLIRRQEHRLGQNP